MQYIDDEEEIADDDDDHVTQRNSAKMSDSSSRQQLPFAHAASSEVAALLAADSLVFHPSLFHQHYFHFYSQLLGFQQHYPAPMQQSINMEPAAKRRKTSVASRSTAAAADSAITFRPHRDINKEKRKVPQKRSTGQLRHSRRALRSSLPASKTVAKEIECIDLSEEDDTPLVEENKAEDSVQQVDCSDELEILEEEEEDNSMTIEHVFPEVMSIIFSYLDVQSRGRAAQVSTRLILFTLFGH